MISNPRRSSTLFSKTTITKTTERTFPKNCPHWSTKTTNSRIKFPTLSLNSRKPHWSAKASTSNLRSTRKNTIQTKDVPADSKFRTGTNSLLKNKPFSRNFSRPTQNFPNCRSFTTWQSWRRKTSSPISRSNSQYSNQSHLFIWVQKMWIIAFPLFWSIQSTLRT